MNDVQPANLIVWRDSVCAGDDCDAPHERQFDAAGKSLRSVAEGILHDQYLAPIAGGRATWILETGERPARPLAVFAQEWPQPRFVVEPDTDIFHYAKPDARPHLQLRYWCQVAPERVLECLQSGHPLPDRCGR